MGEPIGQAIDSLGVRAHMGKGTQVLKAVVVMKVVDIEDDDGRPRLLLATDPGTDWIDQRGLIQCAQEVLAGLSAEEVE